jgi:quercetin dioxygenase-like cupin family protein
MTPTELTSADEFAFPEGSRYKVIAAPANPEHEPLVMEMVYQPRCLAPPPHVHPNASDTFEVLDGTIEVRANGRWHRLQAGESITARPGEVHTFRNRGQASVRVRNVHDPAHSFERYLRRIDAVLREKGFTKVTPRAVLYLAMIERAHAETIRPAPALRVPMAVLASLGRIMRLRLPG